MTNPDPSAPARPLALVTGASGGIGLELAREWARHGFDLRLVARREDRLREAAAAITRDTGVRVDVQAADLTDPADLAALQGWLGEHPVDALVNNAGVGSAAPLADTDLDTLTGLIALNVTALTVLTHAALPGMRARGRGMVLNVSSLAALMPGPGMAAYYASKAYVSSLSEALALELAGSGVTVTALMPGPTRSDFFAAAGARGTLLSLPKASAARVARAGVQAALRGDVLAVPGTLGGAQARVIRHLPRGLTGRLAGALHGLRRER